VTAKPRCGLAPHRRFSTGAEASPRRRSPCCATTPSPERPGHVGRAATTPTVTLQIEYGSWPFPASDIVCRSVFRGWLGKLVTTSATLETTTGVRLGSAYGRFLVQERTAATGFSRYPWETASEPPLTLPQLTTSEREARSFLLSRAALSEQDPAGGDLSYERLYGIVAEEPARPGPFRCVSRRDPTWRIAVGWCTAGSRRAC
jgi:hypothetical protein